MQGTGQLAGVRRSNALGWTLIMIGGSLILAPVILPRPWFGELGHGDGAGIMGLMLMGSLIGVIGIFVIVGALLAGLIKHKRQRD